MPPTTTRRARFGIAVPSILLAGLLGCGSRDSGREQFAGYSDVPLAAMQMPRGAPPQLMEVGAYAQSPPSTRATWTEQQLIRSAELRMQVDRVPVALQAADSIAKQRDALLAEVRVTQDEQGRRSAQVVMRVPALKFAEAIEALKRLGQVNSEAVTTDDVRSSR